jgi:hypothetical protein
MQMMTQGECMMKKIALDTFMDYRMLSTLTLSPDGEKLAYVLTGIDRENTAAHYL